MRVSRNGFSGRDGSGWQRWRVLAAWAVWVTCLVAALAGRPAWAQDSAPPEPAAAAQGRAAAPSAAQLADFLENETTRKALIERLRDVSAQEAAPAPAGAQARPRPDMPMLASGPTEWAATHAQALLDSVSDSVGGAVQAFRELSRTGMSGVALERWMPVLSVFLMVALVTVLAYLALRAAAGMAYRRMDAWLERQSGALAPDAAGPVRPGMAMYRRMLAVIGALALDLLTVVAATAAGHAAAGVLAEPGQGISLLDQAFLRAFLAVEIAKVMVRMVYSPRFPRLRLVETTDESARYWNRWMSGLIAVTGYGIMLFEPLADAMLSPAVGKLFSLVIMLGVYLYGLRGIWTHRQVLRTRLLQQARQFSTAFMSTLVGVFARIWHWLAIGYFTVLFVTSQLDPMNALPFMARATFQTVMAVAAGVLLSGLLSVALSRRIRLSDDIRARLPMLEARVNSYVPLLVRGCRSLVMLSVLLIVLDAWRVFDLPGWVSSESGSRAIAMAVQVLIVLLVALLIWTLVASLIEHRLASDDPAAAPSPRERTLLSLLRNALLVLIVAMTVMVVLAQIGVDVGPLLAGAGVVGLAIGFGAQKLVQDIITGIFIQIENGMNQNDVVEVAGVFGTVEKITIRSVGIRTLDGGFHLIPFSSVDTVTNHMRDFSYHLGEYTIAYRESVDDAIFHLERAFEELMQDEVLAPEILENMTIPGVTSLNERGFTIRVLIKTKPGMQWAVQRGFNRLVKKHFNAANIELPYPHTVVYFGQDKNGGAPPMRWTSEDADTAAPGRAPAAGHTPRSLARRKRGRSEDVLGNEMERTVDEEGNPLAAEEKTPGDDRT